MGIFQQFPYSNFHEMNLDQIIKIMREMQDEWENTKTEWASYKDFIDNYFDNLNLDEETEKALRALIADGTLDPVIDPVIAAEVAAWLTDHITQPTTPAIDTSLTIAGAAADAKATGEALKYIYTVKNIKDRTSWVNQRVAADGSLVNSPSQLTSERILHVGMGNIIKFNANSTNRQISISYYTLNDDNSFTYINSDVVTLRFNRFIKCKHEYLRISFVGTAADPPLLTEFTIKVFPSFNNEFLGKNIGILGDSISTFAGVSESDPNLTTPYYPANNVQWYDQTYAGMFIQASGIANVSVSAISQSAYRDQNDTTKPGAYQDTRITRLSLNGTPDYILINMGTNDPYSVNTGTGIDYTYDVNTLEAQVMYTSYAIQTTIRKIQIAYPNAKIILMIPKFASEIGTANYTLENWNKVCDFIYEVGILYGVYKIIDLRKCGITNETMSTDCILGGMHPNLAGMKKIANYMIKELLLP